MLANFFKKVDFFWFFLIITAILGYGFALVHPSMGIDDEYFEVYDTMLSIVQTNRLGTFISYKLIDTFDFLPIWRDFMAVIFYMLGAAVHADNLNKYIVSKLFDKKDSTLFACLMLSFPYIGYVFIFMIFALEFGLLLLSSGLAVRFLFRYFEEKKDKKNILLSFVFAAFATSLYENGVLFFMVGSLIIILFNFIYDKNFQLKDCIKQTLNVFVIGVFAFLINILLVKLLFITVYGLKNEFIRFDVYLSYDTSSFHSFCVSLCERYYSVFQNFIKTCSSDFGSFIVAFFLPVFLLMTIYYSVKKKNIFVLMLGFLIILLPFVPFFIVGFEWWYRVYAAVGIVTSFSLVWIYKNLSNKVVLQKIMIGVIMLCILYQTKELNQAFYTEHLKYESDKIFANFLYRDLEKLGLNNKPLLLIGLKDNPLLMHDFHTQIPDLNVSIFNWNRSDNLYSELLSPRPYLFMRYHGMNIYGHHQKDIHPENAIPFTDEEITLFKEQIKDMNKYPQEKSIKDCGEYVIVRLGPSMLDQQ